MAWRPSSEQKKGFINAVRQYNAALTRAIKQDKDIEKYLPSRVSTTELSSFKSIYDLNLRIKELKAVNKKGALTPMVTEAGVFTTKYEQEIITSQISRINKFRKNERKRLYPMASTSTGSMGALQKDELRKLKNRAQGLSGKSYEKYKERMEKQSRPSYKTDLAESYKKNYLSAIRTHLGAKGDKLYQYIESLPAKTLYDNYYKGAVYQLDYVYVASASEIEAIADTALDAWQSL